MNVNNLFPNPSGNRAAEIFIDIYRQRKKQPDKTMVTIKRQYATNNTITIVKDDDRKISRR